MLVIVLCKITADFVWSLCGVVWIVENGTELSTAHVMFEHFTKSCKWQKLNFNRQVPQFHSPVYITQLSAAPGNKSHWLDSYLIILLENPFCSLFFSEPERKRKPLCPIKKKKLKKSPLYLRNAFLPACQFPFTRTHLQHLFYLNFSKCGTKHNRGFGW